MKKQYVLTFCVLFCLTGAAQSLMKIFLLTRKKRSETYKGTITTL